MHRFGTAGIVTTALIAMTSPAALAAVIPDGTLDKTFNTSGSVIHPLGTTQSLVEGLTLGPDGSPYIVAFGDDATGASEFNVAKYLPTGAFDATFGLGGLRSDQAGFGMDPISDGGEHLVLAPDGTLVVPGNAGGGVQSEADVQRYTAAGGPAMGFGGGSVHVNYSPSDHISSFNDAVVNPDESVVAVGNDDQTASRTETLIAKFTPAGALDTSFGRPCQGSREFPRCDHGDSPGVARPVRAGRSAAMASRWRRMR